MFKFLFASVSLLAFFWLLVEMGRGGRSMRILNILDLFSRFPALIFWGVIVFINDIYIVMISICPHLSDVLPMSRSEYNYAPRMLPSPSARNLSLFN